MTMSTPASSLSDSARVTVESKPAVPVRRTKNSGKRFSKNKGAVAGLLFMLLVIFCAIFAPWVAPHNPSEQYRDFLLTPPAWLEGGQMAVPARHR